jgi:hypothetical protein
MEGQVLVFTRSFFEELLSKKLLVITNSEP